MHSGQIDRATRSLNLVTMYIIHLVVWRRKYKQDIHDKSTGLLNIAHVQIVLYLLKNMLYNHGDMVYEL